MRSSNIEKVPYLWNGIGHFASMIVILSSIRDLGSITSGFKCFWSTAALNPRPFVCCLYTKPIVECGSHYNAIVCVSKWKVKVVEIINLLSLSLLRISLHNPNWFRFWTIVHEIESNQIWQWNHKSWPSVKSKVRSPSASNKQKSFVIAYFRFEDERNPLLRTARNAEDAIHWNLTAASNVLIAFQSSCRYAK